MSLRTNSNWPNLRPSVLLSIALATVCAGSAFAQQRAPVASLVPIANSVTPAIASGKDLGTIDPTTKMQIHVGLVMRDLTGLEAYADAASDPRSPLYRQWLTPEQIADQFGADYSQTQQLIGYLKGKGLNVVLADRQRIGLTVEGTAAQMQSAFGTTIHSYVTVNENNGAPLIVHANPVPLQIPTQYAAVVQDVHGIETFTRPIRRGTQMNPTAIRQCYSNVTTWNGGFQGQGMTVAFSNWDGLRKTNALSYISTYGLPTPAGGAGTNLVWSPATGGTSNGGTVTGQIEGDLDLQMELASAPLATIICYDGSSTLEAVLSSEASQNVADVISESYGWSYTGNSATTAHSYHVTMNAQGQTYMAASGDSGTHDYTYWTGSALANGSYPYPGDDADVLAVGGTDPTVSGGARSTEPGWSGSGGGWYTSGTTYGARPAWQLSGNSSSTKYPSVTNKLIPDIGLQATTALVYYNGSGGTGLYTVGGTSAASPTFAGLLVVMEQRLAAANGTAKFRLGKIQQLIYSMNGRSDVWFDVTTGSSNGVLADHTTSSNVAGFDLVTGWGAPKMDGFYNSFFMKGHVTLQNWGGSAAQPVTIEIRNSGGTTVQTVNTSLDGSGNFSFIPTQTLAAGTYTLTCKASHWLRQGLTGVSLDRGNLPTNISFSLVNGDCDGDNVVGPSDLNVLRSNFGGSNASADLDGDGVVGPSDLNILRTNFGQSGY